MSKISETKYIYGLFSNTDFNNTTPPESCGFDLTTGEDKFCCTDLGPNSQLVNEPQKPLFKPERHDRTAYPCMDYTSKCEEWTRYYPEHCSPDYTPSGYSVNRYPFMREVCQESCRKIQESQGEPGYFSRTKSVRSNKCENVSFFIQSQAIYNPKFLKRFLNSN